MLNIITRYKGYIAAGLLLVFLLGSQFALDYFDHRLHIYFLDVGQGDSILVRTPTHERILIDGGPDGKALKHLGRVLPLWRQKIDLMVATHNHSDHIGGLDAVLGRYPVERVWLSGAIHTTDEYLRFLEALKKSGAKVELVKFGDVLRFGEVELTVLYPPESAEGLRPENQHDATIVIYLKYKQFSTLLTGDIEEEHEERLLALHPILASSVLKVPHHGSRTSLLPAFLKAVQPSLAIISVGKDNRYGHPTVEALEKLRSAGIPTLRTDQNGTIEVTSDGARFWTVKER